MLIALFSFSGSLATKCISLINEPCIARPTLTDLKPDEHNQGLCHYPFIVSLDICDGSGEAPDDPSSRICVPNKTEDVSKCI